MPKIRVLLTDDHTLFRQGVRRLLESEGCTPADIVKLNSYLVRRMDLPTVAATRKAVLGDVRPAATMIYVAALATPEYLVEVEAWAVRPAP